jgi:hypothetical protein
MRSITTIAQSGYHAYSKACNHKTFDGQTAPRWDALGEYRQQCWQAAALRIADLKTILTPCEELAREAWEAYRQCANSHAKSFHVGQPMPAWEQLPGQRQAAWHSTATHILAELATQQ